MASGRPGKDSDSLKQFMIKRSIAGDLHTDLGRKLQDERENFNSYRLDIMRFFYDIHWIRAIQELIDYAESLDLVEPDNPILIKWFNNALALQVNQAILKTGDSIAILAWMAGHSDNMGKKPDEEETLSWKKRKFL